MFKPPAFLLDETKSFESFGLDKRIGLAISKLGYERPTLVQTHAIPLALQGKDILGKAKTGSGKTAAYAIPIIHKILKVKESGSTEPKIRALVLVPTRELCQQVRDVFVGLTKYCSREVKVFQISGDQPLVQEKPRLAELPDVLIATPSRVVAHINAKNVNLSESLHTLVVDEADLILSHGFEDDLKQLVQNIPSICQSFLMSATLTEDVESLKKLVLHNPAVLKLEGVLEEDNLSQYYINCSRPDRYLYLYFILRFNHINGKVIVFVNNIERGFFVKLFLEKFSIRSAVLNPELPFNSRYHTVQDFNAGKFQILIATDKGLSFAEEDSVRKSKSEDGEGSDSEGEDHDSDKDFDEEERKAAEEEEAAKEKAKKSKGKLRKEKRKKEEKATKDKEFGVARGIDFRNVAGVINFTFPTDGQAYIHRIGRTARAGKHGISISFLSSKKEKGHFAKVLEMMTEQGKVIEPFKISQVDVERFRYRVEGAAGQLTFRAVRQARTAEIKKEILNSEKLKAHFEEHPEDLRALSHDSHLAPQSVSKSLRHVPFYLLPNALAKRIQTATKAATAAAAASRKVKAEGEEEEKEEEVDEEVQNSEGEETTAVKKEESHDDEGEGEAEGDVEELPEATQSEPQEEVQEEEEETKPRLSKEDLKKLKKAKKAAEKKRKSSESTSSGAPPLKKRKKEDPLRTFKVKEEKKH